MKRRFKQLDVFASQPFRGNPLAVILDSDGLSSREMAQIANWMNLSETAFLLPPTEPEADYRVRIFTPSTELAFAGHPTIGSAHAWLQAGGQPSLPGTVVQQCEVGLVPLRLDGPQLAFAAPPLIRSGPVDETDLAMACDVLGLDGSEPLGAQWVDNGAGWMAIQLASATDVLALSPNLSAAESYDIGVVGVYPQAEIGHLDPTEGQEQSDQPAVEVRAFFRAGGQPIEDPVTGSLNASLGQWLVSSGQLTAPYIASQGTAIGRAGRVYISEINGQIWAGGQATTRIEGTIEG